MIHIATGWFEMTQYNYMRAISITNLVETTELFICLRPMEIRQDQGSELLGHEQLNP